MRGGDSGRRYFGLRFACIFVATMKRSLFIFALCCTSLWVGGCDNALRLFKGSDKVTEALQVIREGGHSTPEIDEALFTIRQWLGDKEQRKRHPEITDNLVSDMILPLLRSTNYALAHSSASIYSHIQDVRAVPIIRERLQRNPQELDAIYLLVLKINGRIADANFLINNLNMWPVTEREPMIYTVYVIAHAYPQEGNTLMRELAELKGLTYKERQLALDMQREFR